MSKVNNKSMKKLVNIIFLIIGMSITLMADNQFWTSSDATFSIFLKEPGSYIKLTPMERMGADLSKQDGLIFKKGQETQKFKLSMLLDKLVIPNILPGTQQNDYLSFDITYFDGKLSYRLGLLVIHGYPYLKSPSYGYEFEPWPSHPNILLNPQMVPWVEIIDSSLNPKYYLRIVDPNVRDVPTDVGYCLSEDKEWDTDFLSTPVSLTNNFVFLENDKYSIYNKTVPGKIPQIKDDQNSYDAISPVMLQMELTPGHWTPSTETIPKDVLVDYTTMNAVKNLINQYAQKNPICKIDCKSHTWYLDITAYNQDDNDAENYIRNLAKSCGMTIEWFGYQDFPEPKWNMHLTFLHAPFAQVSENYKYWVMGRDHGKAWQLKNRDSKMKAQLAYEYGWILDRYGKDGANYYTWGFISSLTGWETIEDPLTLIPWIHDY